MAEKRDLTRLRTAELVSKLIARYSDYADEKGVPVVAEEATLNVIVPKGVKTGIEKFVKVIPSHIQTDAKVALGTIFVSGLILGLQEKIYEQSMEIEKD